MDEAGIRKAMWLGHYIQKPETFSYILEELVEESRIKGTKDRCSAIASRQEALRNENGREFLLPFRLSIVNDIFRVSNQGRGRRKRVKQIKGRFISVEHSPLKAFKPYDISTSVWKCAGYPNVYYGTMGITASENGGVRDNGDLLVLYTTNWKEVWIYAFRGLAYPNDVASLEDVVKFVVKDKGQA